jgi:hypothetical protein
MATRYNKKIISKIITGTDGEERLYKASKMSTYDIMKEGFKLLTVLAPAAGSGIDAVMEKQERDDNYMEPMSNLFGKILNMLTSQVTPEHFDDLSRKLIGSLMIKAEAMSMDDIEGHFDDHNGDYLAVLLWLFTENFKDFLWGNAMIRTLIEKVMALLSPKMKDIVENLKKDLNEEINGKS